MLGTMWVLFAAAQPYKTSPDRALTTPGEPSAA
jgi:hypothetical protein